jgi:hypothetical protein
VAGKEALEETLTLDATRIQNRAPLILIGWAANDPQEAREWFARQTSEFQQEYAGSFLRGIARAEPSAAVSILASQFADNRDFLTPQIVDGMITRGGVREAEEVLLQLRDGGDIPYAVRGSLFGGVAMRQIQMARMDGNPAKVLDWTERYMAPNLAGPKALTSLVSFAAQSDAPSTWKWVESHTGEWTPQQAEAVFPAIAIRMQEQAPEEFAEWMNANPDHPQRDTMAAAIARQIAQKGELEQATKWLEVIPDPGKRAALEQELVNTRSRDARRATISMPSATNR